jgi:hypothetical protein
VKINDDKKPNQKRRKDNKTLSKKSEKGRGKTWQKGNKREGTEDCRSGFATLPLVLLQEQPAVVLLLEGFFIS